MRKKEWILIAALTLATILSLSFAPPTGRQEASAASALEESLAEVAAGSPTPSGVPARSATATATPTAAVTMAGPVAATPTATRSPQATPPPAASPTATAFPFDTRPDLARYLYIDQNTQHLYVFEHGRLVRDIPASCGLPESNTYTEAWSGQVGQYWGTFFAFDVYADDAWYLYKSLGSILIHSLPYTLQNGYKVYLDRDALGVRPSSHGCIRIAPEDAAWLTQWNPEGVHATVTDPYLEKWRAYLSN